jgi:hypothetical protein
MRIDLIKAGHFLHTEILTNYTVKRRGSRNNFFCCLRRLQEKNSVCQDGLGVTSD